MLSCFLFIDTSPHQIYTLSLHDALPISHCPVMLAGGTQMAAVLALAAALRCYPPPPNQAQLTLAKPEQIRSEEHTSELQSRVDLVCRLLLEKKKTSK